MNYQKIFLFAAIHAFLVAAPPLFAPELTLPLFFTGGKNVLTPEVLVLARMIMVLVFGYSLVYAGLFFFYQVRGDWGISMVPVAAAGFTKIVVGFVALHAYWVLHVISALPALVGIIDIILGVLYLSFVFRGKK